MRRFSDPAGLADGSRKRRSDVAFHVYDRVGTPDDAHFGAQ